MKIPFMNLSRQYESISPEIDRVMKNVCTETAFIGGKYVDAFEEKFSEYIGAKHTISTSNGTDALFLACKSLGIGPGDHVIVPANTFIASATAVVTTGAEVIFCDCTEDTWEIDPESVMENITSKTKAIMGVHLYGLPFDVKSIKKICADNDLFLIEDCAQAHGATYDGKVVGTFGDVAGFSFYPGKNLGAYGDAGAVVTDNSTIAGRITSLKNHGSMNKYVHDEIGYNMRMDGIQAAILEVKLKHLPRWTSSRRNIAKIYDARISNPLIQKQACPNNTESAYHLYVIHVDNRNRFMDYMESKGISCGIHYPIPCHLQKAFESERTPELPNATEISAHCVSLPMFPELNLDEIEYVVECCNNYCEGAHD